MNRLIVFIILLLVTALLGYIFKGADECSIHEDFSTEYRVLHNNPITIYDEFYSSVYDELFLNRMKNEFEIYNIELYTIKEPKEKSKINNSNIKFLDLGCGNGKHIDILLKKKYKVDGIDISEPMLKRARKLISRGNREYESKLVEGDIMINNQLIGYKNYSHITCFFYTIYYIRDTKSLFERIYSSLMDGGYMIIHLVNKKLFDPVLEKSSKLIPLFNPQRHTDKRVTKTKLKFNKFDYISDWKFIDNNINVEFREQFIFKEPERKLLVNEHKFYMRNIPYYTTMAKQMGFKLIKIVDLLPVNHDNNFLFIFRKG
jgi:SAM-dependent methyltransferase